MFEPAVTSEQMFAIGYFDVLYWNSNLAAGLGEQSKINQLIIYPSITM